ncbi:signal recognition particle-docking protein FtsY [Candidatus Woesearchaeota archaeon]|nr:signal recognition particle-docking protein FtsY [Candidatus Woesearchaeota archaeon]
MFKFLKEKLQEGIRRISQKFRDAPLEKKEEPPKDGDISQEKQEEKPEVPIEKKKREIKTPEPPKGQPKPKPAELPEQKEQKTPQPAAQKESPKETGAKQEEKGKAAFQDTEPAKATSPIPAAQENFQEPIKEQPAEEEPKKKEGFFAKITSAIKEKIAMTTIDREKFDGIFSDLELILLENNVAVEVIEKIKADLELRLVNQPIPRLKIEETIRSSLRSSLETILSNPAFSLEQKISGAKPLVICFVGINGSGKTTTIAKVAHLLKSKGKTVVLAAGDTFRAASIDQLQEHAEHIGVKLIKHDYGSDPAAVAFDAIKHAKSKNADVVLIDTAGRMHSNTNLMDELKKIKKVAGPHLVLFVGEALTGNDCIEQIKEFQQAVGIDGIILTKSDVDEKGGTMISASFVSGKPILFLGTGQHYEHLEPFSKEKLLASLGL